VSKRIHRLEAEYDGSSYQSFPQTDKPWKVRGTIETDKSKRYIEIVMNREQVEELVTQDRKSVV